MEMSAWEEKAEILPVDVRSGASRAMASYYISMPIPTALAAMACDIRERVGRGNAWCRKSEQHELPPRRTADAK